MPSHASAETAVLGVVRSEDNTTQWQGITRRLSASGVGYCVVDLQQVKDGLDLRGAKVLLLPNVETLTQTQAIALQDWMGKGGKVIVTGPIGTLSQPEVRSSLRSLLGAYWGFALTKPSQTRTTGTEWARQSGLNGDIRGGVVIPAGLSSQTAATWKTTEANSPPAVVTTPKSIFLGWRWGVDTVASVEMDSAWLRAALSRYGVKQNAIAPASTAAPPCPYSAPIASQPAPTPPLPGWTEVPANRTNTPIKPTPPTPKPSPTPKPVIQLPPDKTAAPTQQDVPVAPPKLEVKPGSQPIEPSQVIAMHEELANLIGRFESALLASNAAAESRSKKQAADAEKERQPRLTRQEEELRLSRAKAVNEARNGLKTFIQLIAQANYTDARQQWIQSRRTLWDNYPTDSKIAQSEIRAVWLDRGTIVSARSPKDLVRIFDSLAAAGINTVFFETVNAGYAIYPSSIATQNPMTRGWDPLEAAVKLAHARGMELHAWVWIFAAGNQHHNPLLKLPDNYPGPAIAAHPDWANYDNQGRLFDPRSGKVFLDPAHPEVRRYLWDMLDEIATRYQVDGIQLDYIRYPFQDPNANQLYGYGVAARESFKQMTGVDPIAVTPNSNLWQQWVDFRVGQIDTFVATASQRLHAKRPELILSAAVFPFPKKERLQRLQQNWEDWAARGDVDVVVPMTYALETNQLQQLAQPLLNQTALGATLILPGIRLWSLPDVVAIDQIQLLRDLPAGGYSLFAFENISDRLRNIFSRTQGSLVPASPEPVPYRQPFRAAAIRYDAMQQEWNFLQTNKQIWVRDPALSEWNKQAEELSTALNQLAAEPSTKHLSSAKASLSSFRSQFQKWMQLQAMQQPYQVQVWENRLVTLERLLGYGDRVILNRKGKG